MPAWKSAATGPRAGAALLAAALLAAACIPGTAAGGTRGEDITIGVHYILVWLQDGRVTVREIIHIVNNGTAALENGTRVKVSMPSRFTDLESPHVCCLENTDYGFDLLLPVTLAPNDTFTLDMIYRLVDEGGRATLSKRVMYPTESLYVMLQTSTLEVEEVSGLPLLDTFESEEGTVSAYGREGGVKPGFEFSVTVLSPAARGPGIWLWLGIGLIMLPIVGAVVLASRRREDVEKLLAEREAIADVLTKLEEDYKSGQLSEIAYLRARLKFLEKLEKLNKKLAELGVKGEGGGEE